MTTYNKKIPQLPLNQNPSSTGYTIYDDTQTTFSVKVGEFIDTKQWIENGNKIIEADKSVLISDNYVLDNTDLLLLSNDKEYVIGDITVKQESQLYVGGNIILINGNIINNGKISVAGGLIMSGTTSITGNGILI